MKQRRLSVDIWFLAGACAFTLIGASFAFWAAAIEAPAIRDSQDHFMIDIASATEVRRVQSTRTMIAAVAGIVGALSSMIALGLRLRGERKS